MNFDPLWPVYIHIRICMCVYVSKHPWHRIQFNIYPISLSHKFYKEMDRVIDDSYTPEVPAGLGPLEALKDTFTRT